MKSKLFLSLSLLAAIGSISAKSVSSSLPALSINSFGKEVWFLGSKVLTPEEAFQRLTLAQKKQIRTLAWREYNGYKKFHAPSVETPVTPLATVSTQQIMDAVIPAVGTDVSVVTDSAQEKAMHRNNNQLLLNASAFPSQEEMSRSMAQSYTAPINTISAREEAKSDSYYDRFKAAYAAGVVSVGSALSAYANSEEISTKEVSDLEQFAKQEDKPCCYDALMNPNASASQAPSWFDSAKTFSSNHPLSVGTGAVVATASLCYLAYVKRAAISAKAKKAGSSVINLFKRK